MGGEGLLAPVSCSEAFSFEVRAFLVVSNNSVQASPRKVAYGPSEDFLSRPPLLSLRSSQTALHARCMRHQSEWSYAQCPVMHYHGCCG